MSPQLKKGVLKLCVLSKLNKSDRYGYEIYQEINQALEISESTIYPILRGFIKDGICITYLAESNEGPPRKYFKITDSGRKLYAKLYDEWSDFKIIIDNLMNN